MKKTVLWRCTRHKNNGKWAVRELGEWFSNSVALRTGDDSESVNE